MKRIIYDIDAKKKVFYLVLGNEKVGFYLTNRLSKKFFPYLKKGILIDFDITERSKRIGNYKYKQVAHFNQITSLVPHVVYYDLNKLRKSMSDTLHNNKYFIFLDFEMTMPGYNNIGFVAEIIQVGYVISKANNEIVHQDGYYVRPHKDKKLSNRTIRFLNLDLDEFFNNAISYSEFYKKLKKVIARYNPKFVVWGKNDISALNDSYVINKKASLTKDKGFIDLLKLHKDYFNLANDVGLFKAYKEYYDVSFKQEHDAKDDAAITKYVFDAFLNYIDN